MSESTNTQRFTSLLAGDGPIAIIIIKQPLAPIDEDERVIFPPTHPISKDGKKENQKPGYQIDSFSADENICEIDSPQSQSNRIEPKFKTIEDGKLVPQVEIEVGKEKVNLLDVGHRAGDAVVRMSSLAPEIHEAFTAAKSRDFFKLAAIPPTSRLRSLCSREC